MYSQQIEESLLKFPSNEFQAACTISSTLVSDAISLTVMLMAKIQFLLYVNVLCYVRFGALPFHKPELFSSDQEDIKVKDVNIRKIHN